MSSSPIRNQYIQSQQADIADLQKEYFEKKKKIQKSNEDQISELNETYSEKKEFIENKNEAAINHIRSRQTTDQKKALEKQKEIRDKSQKILSETNEVYTKKINDQRQQGQESLQNLTDTIKEKKDTLETDSKIKFEIRQSESKKALENLKNKNNNELQNLNTSFNQTEENARKLNQQQMNELYQSGKEKKEELKENLSSDEEKIRSEGYFKQEKEIAYQNKKLDKVKKDFSERYAQQKMIWEDRDQQLNDSYAQKLLNTKNENQRAIKNQIKTHQNIYNQNQEKNNLSLDIQKNNYVKQLALQKRDFLSQFNRYDGKEEDPFYKVEDRGSKIKEDSNFYYLSAYVPEHEKDSISVVVQKDKVTVQGQRSFNDSFQDEEGKRVSNQSFQTFKEEFPFETMSLPEAVSKEREGDWLYLKIPKFGASKKTYNLG